MRAMVLEAPGRGLVERVMVRPEPGPGQVLVAVAACAVCRTDLHVVDGELPHPKLPIVPGHEIVGRIVRMGEGVEAFATSTRVGIPWLGWTCGQCRYCRSGQENLCPDARFTGYQIDGGYAEYAVADARYCFPIPTAYGDAEAAPLLCAGLIGHRCLGMAGDAERLGLYGFGAAAHIVAQVARYQGRRLLPSPARVTRRRRRLRDGWAPNGPAAPTSRHRRNSTRRSCLRRWAPCCRPPCGRSGRAASSSAAAST